MSSKVIYPPHGSIEKPRIVFLAGPIQGAPDWQSKAIELLSDTGAVIANPRAPAPFHGDYNGQVDWELKYLSHAAYGKPSSGVILFWLAKPDPNEVQPPGRAYAQTSRFELGEWVGRSKGWTVPYFVLGIEPGFSNERYLRRRIGHLWPDIEIPSTLEGTVALAKMHLSGELERRVNLR